MTILQKKGFFMSKINIIRCLLGLLILLNLVLIFGFSSESRETSGQTSLKVTQSVAQSVVKDFDELPAKEQKTVIDTLHPDVRTLAHMAEFGSLGALSMLLLLTFSVSPWRCYLTSLPWVLTVASIDELYQLLADAGRAGELKDVLYDTFGALVCCSILLVLVLIWKWYVAKKRRAPMKITRYQIACEKIEKPMQIALACDLHDNPYQKVVDALKQEAPDLILIPGDLTDDEHINDGAQDPLAFLRACTEIAPTYYSPGNHEVKCYHRGNHFKHPTPIPIPKAYRDAVTETGAVFLNNELTSQNGITFCALGSGLNGKINEPNAEAMARFRQLPESDLKILLCHHPEYIPKLADLGMDLTVCGHAHGGQWRIFGRGVYAPGQGLFPKYTSGVHNQNFVISRGLGDHTSIPRFFNDNELVIITLG